MPDGHRLFPLGLECPHCNKWHGLRDAIRHRRQLHADCDMCKAEMDLAMSLHREATAAVSTIAGQRQTYPRRRAS